MNNYDIPDAMKSNLARMDVTMLTPLQEHFVDCFVGAMTESFLLTDIICIAETGKLHPFSLQVQPLLTHPRCGQDLGLCATLGRVHARQITHSEDAYSPFTG